ncbi:Os11g0656201, partial [Oryza sativa Japonica Group]
WHELPLEVHGHHLAGAADEAPADEHRRHGGPAAAAGAVEPPGELPLHLLPERLPVELVHGGADGELAEQRRHRGAHAAAALGEHHHRPLRRQPRHHLRH